MKLKQTHVSLTTVASIAQQAATKKLDHAAVTQEDGRQDDSAQQTGTTHLDAS